MRLGLGIKISLATLGLLVLSACNHDYKAPSQPSPPSSPPPAATYTVGGTLSGLNGSITLTNNGGDSRTLTANGAFTFATAATSGSAYNVMVTAQPANQTCTVTSGTGSVAASNVSGVTVACLTNAFTVGGTVTGLAGGDLILRNNGANDLTRSADGAFAFTTSVATGSAYAVTIVTQPANQTCTLANASGAIAAANVSNVSVTCTTFRVTGVIGAAGGTLVGPDNVEVVIPAGALTQPTTIGIARSPGGWPTPLVKNATPSGSIYEITPHDVIFSKPVLIRLPAPNGVTALASFVSSFNEGWQYTDVMLNGGFAEMERNVFSWMYLFVTECAPQASDPYPCVFPRGYSFATATPSTALSMLYGVPLPVTSSFVASGSAGSWVVDSSMLTTLNVTMQYTAAPDCAANHMQLKRLVPGAFPPAQLISDQPVSSDAAGEGRVTLSIPPANLKDGVNAYMLGYACTRPGDSETGGGDWITFHVSPSPVPGFPVGGPISGLGASGLELRNWNREIVSVPSGSTSFALGTQLYAGAAYNVRVNKQPVGHVCTIANASGIVAAAVSDIAVTCHSTAPVVQDLVLVANSGSNSLSIFRRDPANGALTTAGSASAGAGPRAIAITSDGRFAYVANTTGNSVSSFTIDKVAGTLTSIPLSTPGTTNPFGLAVDPQGLFLRVANYSAHTVSSFSIDGPSGVLTALGSNPVGLFPYAVVTHPNGNFVYVANEVGSSSSGPSISAFSVNHSTGALTSLGSPTPAPVQSPHSIAITPNGAFAYVVGASGRVGRLTINPVTGALTSGPTTSINGASSSESLAIHPNGSFLYVTASSSTGSFVQVFSIDSAGALTAVAQVPAGAGSNFVTIDSAGHFICVTNQSVSAVATYSINGVTGDLTLVWTDAVGVAPQGVAITP